MRRYWILAVLAVTACGQAPRQPAAAPVVQAPSAFQNQVAALQPGERDAVFIRAIRDAGHDCQGVTESHKPAKQPASDPLYVAKCSDGASYGVLIGRDGTAQVVAAGAN